MTAMEPTNPSDPASSGRPGRRWAHLLGWILSLVLIVAMLRSVPARELWQALSGVSAGFLVLAMLLAAVNPMLRGLRWALFFRPARAVSVPRTTALALIGLAINAVLPGRIGDFARVFLAMRHFSTTFVLTAATLVVERLFDGLTLLALFGVSALLLPALGESGPVSVLGRSVDGETIELVFHGLATACGLLALAVLLLALPATHALGTRLVGFLPVVGQRIEARADALFADLGGALRGIGRPRLLLPTALLSLAMWFALALCNWAVSLGMSEVEVTLVQALVVTAVSVGVSFIPSVPGAWGVFEAGALFALGVVGVDAPPASLLAYAFLIHLCQYLPVVLLGALAVLRQPDALRSVSEAAQSR
jgi:uncharacterized membrane protein YbhN (UPF0104 family)